MVSHSSSQASASAQGQRLPRIPRPEIKLDVSEEDWISFLAIWKNFKKSTGIIEGSTEEVDHLYQCCDKNLARLLIREEPDILNKKENDLLEAMKRLAVIKIATSVRRTNLLSMKQQHAESFREYYANVRAAAATCDFQVNCKHDCCKEKTAIDYTSSVVKDVLITGIADMDIRKEVLAWEELDSKDDKDVVAFIESKEIVQAAFSRAHTTNNAGVSAYKKVPKQDTRPKTDLSIKQKLALKGICKKCNTEISLYKRYQSGKINSTAFILCRQCHLEKIKDENASLSKSPGNTEPSMATVEFLFRRD